MDEFLIFQVFPKVGIIDRDSSGTTKHMDGGTLTRQKWHCYKTPWYSYGGYQVRGLQTWGPHEVGAESIWRCGWALLVYGDGGAHDHFNPFINDQNIFIVKNKSTVDLTI